MFSGVQSCGPEVGHASKPPDAELSPNPSVGCVCPIRHDAYMTLSVGLICISPPNSIHRGLIRWTLRTKNTSRRAHSASRFHLKCHLRVRRRPQAPSSVYLKRTMWPTNASVPAGLPSSFPPAGGSRSGSPSCGTASLVRQRRREDALGPSRIRTRTTTCPSPISTESGSWKRSTPSARGKPVRTWTGSVEWSGGDTGPIRTEPGQNWKN